MKQGYLSEFFTGVALKKLSAVEADPARSNQHEFNGVTEVIQIFGRAKGKQTHEARFIYLSDGDDEPVLDTGFVTWYDAREKHPTRTEHRLYFPATAVSILAAEGDLLVIGRRPDNTVLVVIAQGGSTISNQIQWLFKLSPADRSGFSVREELESEQDRLQFASRTILEQIGIVAEPTEENLLEKMLSKFEGKFPVTREFSAFARSVVGDIDVERAPDDALMSWIEKEEILFRTMEKHLIADRLTAGFKDDVDGFISYSLSVQNRRKSRVGFALENHMEELLQRFKIRYQRSALTERKSKPDFLFPGSKEYAMPAFDSVLLTMLGVKSTCKDRWRQVLAEASRITSKHLLTLETGITTDQTGEMAANKLQLVVPAPLHDTYTEDQRKWLFKVSDFIQHVKAKQAKIQ
jgi:EcoRII C terminal